MVQILVGDQKVRKVMMQVRLQGDGICRNIEACSFSSDLDEDHVCPIVFTVCNALSTHL